MTPPGMTARLDVTLTDEPPLAQAVVIITAPSGRYPCRGPGRVTGIPALLLTSSAPRASVAPRNIAAGRA